MPRFWRKHQDGSYSLRLIAKEIAMPWSHPVEVNYLEAKAFCNWKTELEGNLYRLPTEAEWYHLRDTYMSTDQPLWDKAPGNINLEYFASACPVNRFRFGDFYDIVGNVWQWTETPISGFPGFKIHPYYDDFSVPIFDGRHNLIKGGSFISTGNEALRASRYAFRRHFYQHAGFRYIESEAEVVIEDNLYEDDPEIVTFCDLDWDSCFARELMDKILDTLPDLKTQKVLQIGCKTGRLAMEAAKYGQSVVGIDATARIIQLATSMKEQGLIRYSRQDEGEIIQTVERNLAEFGLEEIAEKVEFWQADSSNLAAKYCGYDLILGVNALEEARNPIAFIREIPNRLLPGDT
jgi:2-polyprenyl-3-methyl-5-hydroxy-6-metoxy-1,4-benzoquinol methylase